MDIRDLSESPKFLEFINRAFDKAAVHCSVEEMAEFAFGSVEEAVKQFYKEFGTEDETV
jgi:hypothetical protein